MHFIYYVTVGLKKKLSDKHVYSIFVTWSLKKKLSEKQVDTSKIQDFSNIYQIYQVSSLYHTWS